MNNKDTILRYLSDLMEDGESAQFEERLKSDTELKGEFDKVQSNLNQLKAINEFEEDSNYFNSLVPKVRHRIDPKKKKMKLGILPAFSFVVAILVVVFMQFPSSTEQNLFDFNISTKELSSIVNDTDSLTIDELFETNFVEDYAYYNTSQSTEEFNDNIDDSFISGVSLNDIDSYYNTEEVAEYDELSNAQVDIVYEELINKKIL